MKRWELTRAMLDKMKARLDHMPEVAAIRRQTVEHPFGTLKAWMGSTHFLTRTLEKGQNRDEACRSTGPLQYEANDQYLRRQPADAGDRGLTAPRRCRGTSHRCCPTPASEIMFSHGLGRLDPFAAPFGFLSHLFPFETFDDVSDRR